MKESTDVSSSGSHGNGIYNCNGVFSKACVLRNSKLCLNTDIFTGLIEPEHLEKYISLPAKTEEIV